MNMHTVEGMRDRGFPQADIDRFLSISKPKKEKKPVEGKKRSKASSKR